MAHRVPRSSPMSRLVCRLRGRLRIYASSHALASRVPAPAITIGQPSEAARDTKQISASSNSPPARSSTRSLQSLQSNGQSFTNTHLPTDPRSRFLRRLSALGTRHLRPPTYGAYFYAVDTKMARSVLPQSDLSSIGDFGHNIGAARYLDIHRSLYTWHLVVNRSSPTSRHAPLDWAAGKQSTAERLSVPNFYQITRRSTSAAEHYVLFRPSVPSLLTNGLSSNITSYTPREESAQSGPV